MHDVSSTCVCEWTVRGCYLIIGIRQHHKSSAEKAI